MNTFETLEQYENARKIHDINHAALTTWLRDHKTNASPCEISAQLPFANEVTNELKAKIEVWEFLHDKPRNYFLYIDEETRKATNWTGEFLGNVHFGNVYTSNMGDERQSIDVFGINGLKYHGIYFKSSGNYARIKAYKKQSCPVS